MESYHVLNPVDRDVYLTIEMEGFQLKRLLLRKPGLAFERHCELVVATLASIPGVAELQPNEDSATQGTR